MKLKFFFGKLYRWVLYTLIYNKVNAKLFFPNGYPKMINGQKIRVPFNHSLFYSDVYEQGKSVFIKSHCKAGDTVIDIGAHMGIFSFIMARQVGEKGKVYSFEPAALTFNVLRKTIAFNKLTDIVEARQQAVSSFQGNLEFYIYNNSEISNGNSISSHNTTGTSQKTIVSCTTLDELFVKEKLKDLTLVKIDAEGAELDILKGGKKLFTTFRPFITLEVHPKSFDNPNAAMVELFDTIMLFGYRVFKDNDLLSKQEFCACPNYFEVVLIPG